MPGHVSPAKRLTPLQKRYVQFRAQGHPPYDAAEAAGYTGNATQDTYLAMESLPHVQNAISHARTATVNAKRWTVDGWRAEAEAALEQAKHEKNLEQRMRWLDIAAKHLGIYQNTQTDAKLVTDVLATLALAGARTRVLTEGKVIESEAAELPVVPIAPLDARAAQDQ